VAVTAVLSLLLLNPLAARQRSRQAEPSLALANQDVA
jgi:hypothetical protein